MPVVTRRRSTSRRRREAPPLEARSAPNSAKDTITTDLEKHMAAQSTALSAIAEQLAQLNQNLLQSAASVPAPASAPAPAPLASSQVTSGSKRKSGTARKMRFRSTRGKYAEKPRRVYCRFSWFQLDDIDLVKHTFHCKGYFEATWHAPELLNSSSDRETVMKDIDWNDSGVFSPQIIFANKAGELTHDFEKFVINEKATELFGGELMASYQTVFHGDFTTEYSLQPFPYDEQIFEIIIGTGHTIEDVVFVPNPHVPSIAPGIDKFSLNDTWLLTLMDGKDGMRILPCMKGVMGDRSRCATVMLARRRPQYYEVNILLMNFIIVLLCFTMFLLPVSDVADRINIAMTAMLTSVAFKTYVADQLPDLSYLTFLDKYLLSGILLLVLMVFETIFVNTIFDDDHIKGGEVDKQLFLVLILLFLFGNIVAFNERLLQCCRHILEGSGGEGFRTAT